MGSHSFIFSMNTITQHVISIVNDYSDKQFSKESKTYLSWAKQELIDRLTQRSYIPPLVVLDDFNNQMKIYYSYKSDIAFETAYILSDGVIQMLVG